jgi:hypothetical protein
VTRLQQFGLDRLTPAERVALARELLASAAATASQLSWETLTIAEVSRAVVSPPAPADEWERQLFAAAIDCGVSVPDEVLSSDGLYD